MQDRICQIDENLLQRTAGPYIGVIFLRSTRSRRSRHVRFAPIASEPSHRSDSTRGAKSGCEQSQQMTSYSMTSSARAESVGGTSMPSAFAVLRLMTNSNLVVCTVGSSVVLAPLRMRPV